MNPALQLGKPASQISFMGNVKPTGDWKFWLQLCVIMVAIGGGLQANHEMQRKVQALEKSNVEKTEIILRMEGKFDLLNLKIEQLNDQLRAKKIVNQAVFDASHFSGETHFERKK
jgi:hypothetical protein